MIKQKNAIILAAGKGTRMHQEIPKCACKVLGKPMINHLVDTLKELSFDNITIVVGYQKEVIIDLLKDEKVEFVVQEEQLGTGHACKMAYDKLKDFDGDTLILAGDMPLVGTNNINLIMNYHNENNYAMTILSALFENPFSYGRIIRDNNNNVTDIIEEKEATDAQKLIKEINTGLYVVDNKILFETLKLINNNNNKGEYYLTDIVNIISKNNPVGAYCAEYDYRLMGINDVKTLELVESLAKQKDFN